MSKFTQGPWSTDADNAIYAGNEPIAMAFGFGAGRSYDHTPETAANARLIAMAPELLDAVRQLAEDLEDGHWSFTKQHLRVLVAKATGEGA